VKGLVRQHRIDLPGYGAARFDLALPLFRWALEVDVFPTHAETIGRQRDARRDAAALRCGWTVRRIPAEEYRRDFEGAIESAVDDLRERRG
jgi:very-short-patch-repair endonuclease